MYFLMDLSFLLCYTFSCARKLLKWFHWEKKYHSHSPDILYEGFISYNCVFIMSYHIFCLF